MCLRIMSRDIANQDPWRSLTRYTAARIGLGRAGVSVPTRALLEFQLAHAQARDAVHRAFDAAALQRDLSARGWEVLRLHSAAPDRQAYIQRPDLGRILNDASKVSLEERARPPAQYDVALIVADGLSALAVERHAVAVLECIMAKLVDAHWNVAPVCVVEQGRVAVADEIGALLGAQLSVILIGERPGLSSPDSLGIYLTWDPLPGRSNAQRNCISNVRPEGLSYELAAHKLFYLMTAARQRKLSGVDLKDEAPALGDVDAVKKAT
jgi:ethanolamine ammonia-lyase small subunit